MRLTDADALAGKVKRHELPEGGWRTTFFNSERAADFQVKAWKGLAWAPVAAGLTKRRVWYQCAENIKANRATLAGLVPPGDVPNDRRIKIGPSFFDYQTLNRFGK